MAITFPNTGSTITRGTSESPAAGEGRTSTGLSTQIIIKVKGVAVGALQKLSVSQGRNLYRVNEIGTDGCVEIVPKESTTFDLSADRIVFDNLRLPEAFSRSFRFINAQRIPFDIEIYDTSVAGTPVVMKYVNCWFTKYDTPYTSENYIITETAQIWAETGFVISTADFAPVSLRGEGGFEQTDSERIEAGVNRGLARGGIDTAGLINSIFG